MICSVCPKPLTAKQIKEYERKHGHKRYLRPPPVCSAICAGKAKRAPPKHERKESWATRDNGWDSTPFVGK